MNSLHQFVNEKLYKDHLNPKYWDSDMNFDSTVRTKLLKIAKDFTDDLDITQYVKDIQLTGSIANYNYTKYSDLDLHILVNFKDINSNTELVKSNLDGKRFIWNLKHDIIIRNHEVEIYFQDTKEAHTSTGVYSLLEDKWITKPKYNPPEVNEKYIKYKANEIKKQIELLRQRIFSATKSKDLKLLYNKVTKFREKIIKMRKDSLEMFGEFGIGNLVFKQLRNSGDIEKVINLSNQSYDKIFSEKLSVFNK